MRRFEKLGWTIPPIGVGTFAMGGTALADGKERSWPGVDPAEARAGLDAALGMGASVIHTADVYGAGHAEREIGVMLGARRDCVKLATKFGKRMDEGARTRLPGDVIAADEIVAACEASLRRLRTDRIDLYQFHIAKADSPARDEVRDTLERLVRAGKILAFGWSTDDLPSAQAWSDAPAFGAVQIRLNVFEGNADLVARAEAGGWAALCREPLAQGLLTGKYAATRTLAAGDVREKKWNLREGPAARRLAAFEDLRELLTTGGRTPVQGALSWLLARSPATLPIPGFKTAAQVRDALGALELDPLPLNVMAEIDTVRTRHEEAP